VCNMRIHSSKRILAGRVIWVSVDHAALRTLAVLGACVKQVVHHRDVVPVLTVGVPSWPHVAVLQHTRLPSLPAGIQGVTVLSAQTTTTQSWQYYQARKTMC
jgi:hypothetical protein